MKTKLPRLLLALLLIALALPSADVAASSCEEQAYQDCLTYCYGLALEGRCDFYANQLCLCMRAPADCPVCY